MHPVLVNLVPEWMAFLEEMPDEVLDPDVAVEWEEYVISQLQRLSQPERSLLVAAAREKIKGELHAGRAGGLKAVIDALAG